MLGYQGEQEGEMSSVVELGLQLLLNYHHYDNDDDGGGGGANQSNRQQRNQIVEVRCN